MNRYKKMHEQWVNNVEKYANGHADPRGISFTRKDIDELSKRVAQDCIEVENILRESYALAAAQP
jgi:hypothetical protein